MLLRAFKHTPTRLCFRTPFVTAHGRLTAREGWLVQLQTDTGLTGLGEAAPLPGFTPETAVEAGDALAEAAALLRGRALRPEHPSLSADPRIDPLADLGLQDWALASPTARHALECALLDVLAQAAGLPLASFLAAGARAPRSVKVNATLGEAGIPESLAQAQSAVAQGFGTLKLKVGRDAARDTERLRVLRAALGPAVRLRVDANEAWDLATAVPLLRAWAPLNLEYVEQPLPAADLAGMVALAQQSSVPLAADEALLREADAERLMATGAARVLVLKPMALGGLLPALRVARQAAARGVPVVLTTLLEGAIGRTAALHAAAAIHALHQRPAPHLACGLATGGLLLEDHLLDSATPMPQPHAGALSLPQGAGLGLRMKGAMVEA